MLTNLNQRQPHGSNLKKISFFLFLFSFFTQSKKKKFLNFPFKRAHQHKDKILSTSYINRKTGNIERE